MSLTPSNNNDNQVVSTSNITYRLDMENNELKNELIDAENSVRQSIYKILNTPRNRYPIYSSDYGCDIEKILAESLPFNFLKDELPREIRTSLLIDTRIKEVRDFKVVQTGDGIQVDFTVILVNGLAFYEGVKF